MGLLYPPGTAADLSCLTVCHKLEGIKVEGVTVFLRPVRNHRRDTQICTDTVTQTCAAAFVSALHEIFGTCTLVLIQTLWLYSSLSISGVFMYNSIKLKRAKCFKSFQTLINSYLTRTFEEEQEEYNVMPIRDRTLTSSMCANIIRQNRSPSGHIHNL